MVFSPTVETTIDRAGRLVIPKLLREALGLAQGGRVVITEHDGRLVIEPVVVDKTLVRHGRGLVCAPIDELPPLSADQVREALESTRR